MPRPKLKRSERLIGVKHGRQLGYNRVFWFKLGDGRLNYAFHLEAHGDLEPFWIDRINRHFNQTP